VFPKNDPRAVHQNVGHDLRFGVSRDLNNYLKYTRIHNSLSESDLIDVLSESIKYFAIFLFCSGILHRLLYKCRGVIKPISVPAVKLQPDIKTHQCPELRFLLTDRNGASCKFVCYFRESRYQNFENPQCRAFKPLLNTFDVQCDCHFTQNYMTALRPKPYLKLF
jgi:hypothetical protein